MDTLLGSRIPWDILYNYPTRTGVLHEASFINAWWMSLFKFVIRGSEMKGPLNKVGGQPSPSVNGLACIVMSHWSHVIPSHVQSFLYSTNCNNTWLHLSQIQNVDCTRCWSRLWKVNDGHTCIMPYLYSKSISGLWCPLIAWN